MFEQLYRLKRGASSPPLSPTSAALLNGNVIGEMNGHSNHSNGTANGTAHGHSRAASLNGIKSFDDHAIAAGASVLLQHGQYRSVSIWDSELM